MLCHITQEFGTAVGLRKGTAAKLAEGIKRCEAMIPKSADEEKSKNTRLIAYKLIQQYVIAEAGSDRYTVPETIHWTRCCVDIGSKAILVFECGKNHEGMMEAVMTDFRRLGSDETEMSFSADGCLMMLLYQSHYQIVVPTRDIHLVAVDVQEVNGSRRAMVVPYPAVPGKLCVKPG